jgi:hypothetical protein
VAASTSLTPDPTAAPLAGAVVPPAAFPRRTLSDRPRRRRGRRAHRASGVGPHKLRSSVRQSSLADRQSKLASEPD